MTLRLTFLGTRGGIVARSPRHRRHSALLIEHRGRRVLVDCGGDWRGHVDALAPDAILVTHAHPDHAGALAGGAPCPVYATAATWRLLGRAPVADRRTVTGAPVPVCGLTVEAFPVIHSVRAPTVGFRIATRDVAIVYLPDVADLPSRAALAGVALYIGDGARLTNPLIRRTPEGRRFGHAPIRTQLGWCARAGVPRAIFTHCGTEIVAGDGRVVAARVRAMGRELGVDARLASDGLVVDLPRGGMRDAAATAAWRPSHRPRCPSRSRLTASRSGPASSET